MTTLSNLPRDNILTILSFLYPKTVISLGLTSKHFEQITKNQREENIKRLMSWKIFSWWRWKRDWTSVKTYEDLELAFSNISDDTKIPASLFIKPCYSRKYGLTFRLAPGYIHNLDKNKRQAEFYRLYTSETIKIYGSDNPRFTRLITKPSIKSGYIEIPKRFISG
uniref:F-box domain protein n=1 Tax=Marseillevirus LCMAC102 TaxID=2506603 RepID=A0A481YTP1_9VIRU|nr:MAG: F-box domain protein [Marseillevirus LCMAC102]